MTPIVGESPLQLLALLVKGRIDYQPVYDSKLETLDTRFQVFMRSYLRGNG